MRILLLLLCLCGCQGKLVVNQVISADTVVLSNGQKVRYAGVEGPKQPGEWFEKCRVANAFLVESKVVRLVKEPELSSSETTVAYVYSPILVDGKEKFLYVNEELLKFGYVTATPMPKGCQRKDLWQGLWQWQKLKDNR